jgi:DNA-binding response OmpR family regulator
MNRRRIVVIEDDDDLRRVIAMLLEGEGYEVSAFGSAREGLRALEQDPAADLIVLDLMMPDMNGWEFCEQWGGSAKLADVPVLVITARRNVEGLTGVAEVLFKPFDGGDLLEAIARTTARTSVG